MFSRSVRGRRTSRMRMGGSLTLSVRPANDAPVAVAAPAKEEPAKRIVAQSQPLKRRPRLAAPDAKPKNNTSRGMRLGLAANGGKSEKKLSGSRRLGMSESNRGQEKKKATFRPRLGMAKPDSAAKKEEPAAPAKKPRARLGVAKK